MKNVSNENSSVLQKPPVIPPIVSRITEPATFIKIMPFLDRGDVLQDIQQYRNELGITKLVPYNNFKEWFYEATDSNKGTTYYQTVWYVYQHGCPSLLLKYGRYDINYHALFMSIVCGAVADADCVDTFIKIHDPNLTEIVFPYLAIVFNSYSTQEEILRVFHNRQETIDEFKTQYSVVVSYYKPPVLRSSVSIEALENNRTWYWEYTPYQFSYRKVAKNNHVLQRTIISGIKHYKKRILQSAGQAPYLTNSI